MEELIFIVKIMLDSASKYGLQAEVMASFTSQMKSGKNMYEACVDAMHEWDVSIK